MAGVKSFRLERTRVMRPTLRVRRQRASFDQPAEPVLCSQLANRSFLHDTSGTTQGVALAHAATKRGGTPGVVSDLR